MNPLRALAEKGQSVWLDFLSRDIIENGHLKRLIDDDGLSGITSNPSIFEKAIGESDSYDDEIKRLVGKGETVAQHDLRALGHRRHRRCRRHAAPALRQDRGPARLRQPGSVALSRHGYGRDDRRKRGGCGPRSGARISSSRCPPPSPEFRRSANCSPRDSISTLRCCSRSRSTRRSSKLFCPRSKSAPRRASRSTVSPASQVSS